MNNWEGLTAKEHRLYNIWIGMIQRCENPEREKYQDYGARGISVCSEWHDFRRFVSWAKQNGYKDDLTIDRKNVDGNYEPLNCRWATPVEQSNNKRSSVVLSCSGINGTVKQWSELLRVSPYTIYDWVSTRGIEYAEARVVETVQNGGLVQHTDVKKCVKCGREYTVPATATSAKYCPLCRKIAEREKYARYRAKRKAHCGAEVVG